MNLWLKDPKTGKPSITVTVFVYGFIVATLKLFLAGIEIIDKVKMSDFSGTDYAAVLGALGLTYTLRKNKTIKEENKE